MEIVAFIAKGIKQFVEENRDVTLAFSRKIWYH